MTVKNIKTKVRGITKVEDGFECPEMESRITISFTYCDRRDGTCHEAEYAMKAIRKHCYENADGLYNPIDPRMIHYFRLNDADNELFYEILVNYLEPLESGLNHLGYDMIDVDGFSFSLVF